MTTVHVSRAGDGPHLVVGADVTTIRASSATTSGRLLMLEVVVPPGGGPPTLHRHEYAETFHFLEGAFEVSTADESRQLRTVHVAAGDVVSIPSMAWHNFKNVGTSHGRFMVVHSSVVMEALIHKIGCPIADPAGSPGPVEPPSHEDMKQLMAEIGKYVEMWPADAVRGGHDEAR